MKLMMNTCRQSRTERSRAPSTSKHLMHISIVSKRAVSRHFTISTPVLAWLSEEKPREILRPDWFLNHSKINWTKNRMLSSCKTSNVSFKGGPQYYVMDSLVAVFFKFLSSTFLTTSSWVFFFHLLSLSVGIIITQTVPKKERRKNRRWVKSVYIKIQIWFLAFFPLLILDFWFLKGQASASVAWLSEEKPREILRPDWFLNHSKINWTKNRMLSSCKTSNVSFKGGPQYYVMDSLVAVFFKFLSSTFLTTSSWVFFFHLLSLSVGIIITQTVPKKERRKNRRWVKSVYIKIQIWFLAFFPLLILDFWFLKGQASASVAFMPLCKILFFIF